MGIAATTFWFSQDGGGVGDLIANSAAGFSLTQLGIGAIVLLVVGYTMTNKSETADATRGGIFDDFLDGSSKPAGGKGRVMGFLLVVIVLVSAGAVYWHFYMQQAPRRRRRRRRGADLV